MNRINSLKYEVFLNFNNEKEKDVVYKILCYGCLVKTKCITLVPFLEEKNCLRVYHDHGCESLWNSVQQIPFDKIKSGCIFKIEKIEGALRVRKYELERGKGGLTAISDNSLKTIHKQM